MSLAITDDVTIADIDEAIKHINDMLKIDEYGNRMEWRKKELLQKSIDDLLDARISLALGEKIFDWCVHTDAFFVQDSQPLAYRTKQTLQKNFRYITWPIITRSLKMPRKSAKQIVTEVVTKVNEELPKKKAAPKKEEPKITVEHYYRCMTIIAPGSNCNCYASKA